MPNSSERKSNSVGCVLELLWGAFSITPFAGALLDVLSKGPQADGTEVLIGGGISLVLAILGASYANSRNNNTQF